MQSVFLCGISAVSYVDVLQFCLAWASGRFRSGPEADRTGAHREHLPETPGEPPLRHTDQASAGKAWAAVLSAGYTVTAVLLHVSDGEYLVFAVSVEGRLLGFAVFPVVGEAEVVVMIRVVVTAAPAAEHAAAAAMFAAAMFAAATVAAATQALPVVFARGYCSVVDWMLTSPGRPPVFSCHA